MLRIPCIHCGPRNAAEFTYLGEERSRPDPNATRLQEWRRYLYMQSNPAGWTTERWFHRDGCRRFFVMERHTVSDEIRAVRRPSAQLRLDPDGAAGAGETDPEGRP